MLDIFRLELTLFQQNCRIIPADDGTALVIDPGGDVPNILDFLRSRTLECSEIWLTHSHLDHCGGVQKLIDATGARLYGHPEEREMRALVSEIAAAYGIPAGVFDPCPEPDEYIQGGEVLEFGGHTFQTLFTPGHSPGHLCFYHEASGKLLAGDTLFAGSIGRTDLPGGHHKTLIDSIRREIFTLPDETEVLPGHGPDTTVGEEKRSNPFLQGT